MASLSAVEKISTTPGPLLITWTNGFLLLIGPIPAATALWEN